MNKFYFVIAAILLIGCTATPEPEAPKLQVKQGNPTPCEVQSDVPCDNYDRAAILLGDSVRSTVQGIKAVGSYVGEKASEVYQDYQSNQKTEENK